MGHLDHLKKSYAVETAAPKQVSWTDDPHKKTGLLVVYANAAGKQAGIQTFNDVSAGYDGGGQQADFVYNLTVMLKSRTPEETITAFKGKLRNLLKQTGAKGIEVTHKGFIVEASFLSN